MKFAIVGLGRMGNSIAYRVLKAGHEVVGFDLSEDSRKAAEKIGVETVSDISAVAKKSRIIWLMIPAGNPVDSTIEKLLPNLEKSSILIDGGNSNFKDSVRRAKKLRRKDFFFLDCGTSGGLRGREIGFSLMVGGEKEAYEKIIPLFKAISMPGGFGYTGPSGSGHYVKMIHNGIEYGLLQAYAEGFHLLKEGRYKDLDLENISQVWLNGSVIRSWLLELMHEIYSEKTDFSKISGEAEEGGTGRWTVEESREQNVPLRVIEEALKIRGWSRKTGGNYATKLVALLRNKFGGHKTRKK